MKSWATGLVSLSDTNTECVGVWIGGVGVGHWPIVEAAAMVERLRTALTPTPEDLRAGGWIDASILRQTIADRDAARAEVERLKADLLVIAEAVGVVYEADGHNSQPGPTKAIVSQIRIMRGAWEATFEPPEEHKPSPLPDGVPGECAVKWYACPEQGGFAMSSIHRGFTDADDYPHYLHASLAAAKVAEEREACAKVADSFSCDLVAADIRERGKP